MISSGRAACFSLFSHTRLSIIHGLSMLLSWERITHKQQVRSQQQGEQKQGEAAAVTFTRHSSDQDHSHAAD